jgi:hypothetical protein
MTSGTERAAIDYPEVDDDEKWEGEDVDWINFVEEWH